MEGEGVAPFSFLKEGMAKGGNVLSRKYNGLALRSVWSGGKEGECKEGKVEFVGGDGTEGGPSGVSWSFPRTSS